MSHSTIGRDIDGVHLTAIHNGDHSGPTQLVVVRTKDDKVLGELEVPDGDMLVELALRIAVQRLTDIKNGETDSGAERCVLAMAIAVLEETLDNE